MEALILTSLVIAAILFGIKILYVVSTALVIRSTRGALYVSTSKKRIAAFLDAVPLEAEQVLIDLGCGDGRVLREARKRYGITAIGYELNPLAYLKACLLCIHARGITLRMRDFFLEELPLADVIFCYLFPDVMKDLAEKLRSELKPGTLVVSCNFALPTFTAERVLRPGTSLHNDPIYMYRVRSASDEKRIPG